MSNENASTSGTENGQETASKQQEQGFTQADVDRIVNERLTREKAKYADYDDLKAKAEGAKTVEQKLAELEAKHAEAESRALRSSIAAEYGISTKKGPKGEPSDADLFLTGSDEATLTTQAKRLAEQIADRKKHGNVAPKEGATTTIGKGDQDLREFTRNLFGRTE